MSDSVALIIVLVLVLVLERVVTQRVRNDRRTMFMEIKYAL
jgi:hypothetical protein